MTLSNKEKKELLEELKNELNNTKKVYVEICREDIQLPNYASIGDAGMDIRAAEDILLMPEETKIIPTGLKMAIPFGYEIQVRPRSGLSLKTPLRISNSPGTIDSGYRDEIGIIMSNTSSLKYCNDIYELNSKENKFGAYDIKKGDRIAQIILCKVEKIEFEQVEKNEIATIGSNRGGGFGHSGTN